MIIVLFPSGGFGSTIEYSLRRFTNELTKIEATVMEDGSMHSYLKECHTVTLDWFLKNKDSSVEIATPIYPGLDCFEPLETVNKFKDFISKDKKVILIHFNTLCMAERNTLFAYYKIQNFLSFIMKDKQTAWSSDYKSFTDMKIYELREALSFYIDQQLAYLKIKENIVNDWLYITPDDILYNFKNTILKIINYCDLTVDQSNSIDEFFKGWFSKQQYILEEFKKIDNIVNAVTNNQYFEWTSLSIMAEAIIQSRLKRIGMEFACYNLDVFPTNTKDLQKNIIKE